ncbi:MAG: hypothetical protein ACE5F1_01840 [Planctomycetota bacterium]
MSYSRIVSFIREHCPLRPLDETWRAAEVCRAKSLVGLVLEALER